MKLYSEGYTFKWPTHAHCPSADFSTPPGCTTACNRSICKLLGQQKINALVGLEMFKYFEIENTGNLQKSRFCTYANAIEEASNYFCFPIAQLPDYMDLRECKQINERKHEWASPVLFSAQWNSQLLRPQCCQDNWNPRISLEQLVIIIKIRVLNE